MRLTLGLTLVALSLAFAPAPLPRPAAASPVGTWEVVTEALAGRPVPPRGVTTVVISANQLVATLDEKLVRRFRLTFDAKAKPATMDLDPQGEGRGERWLCLYELRGDTLVIVKTSGNAATTRPKKVDEKDTQLDALTLRRKK